jgi:hypothetical protein
MAELLKKDYVTVSFEEEIKALYVMWGGSGYTSEQYKEVWGICIAYGENNKVDYFLSDITNQKVVNPDDRKWFEEVALPRAVKTGIKKGATIVGANPFTRFYINNIMKKIGGTSLPFKAFKNKEEAFKWFVS